MAAGSLATGTINFAGGDATLAIGGSALPTSVISGFDAGNVLSDEIVLNDVAYSSNDTATLGADNTVTLDLSGTISTLHFDPSQNYAGHYFEVEANSQGNVVFVDPTSNASMPKLQFLNLAANSPALATASTAGSATGMLSSLMTDGSLRASFLPASLAGIESLGTFGSSGVLGGLDPGTSFLSSIRGGTPSPLWLHRVFN